MSELKFEIVMDELLERIKGMGIKPSGETDCMTRLQLCSTKVTMILPVSFNLPLPSSAKQMLSWRHVQILCAKLAFAQA